MVVRNWQYFNGGKKLANDMAKVEVLKQERKSFTDDLHWSRPGG
jgi:hypothetical protein